MFDSSQPASKFHAKETCWKLLDVICLPKYKPFYMWLRALYYMYFVLCFVFAEFFLHKVFHNVDFMYFDVPSSFVVS